MDSNILFLKTTKNPVLTYNGTDITKNFITVNFNNINQIIQQNVQKKYVLYIDGNLTLKEYAIECLVIAIERDKEISMVYGDYQLGDKIIETVSHSKGNLNETFNYGFVFLIKTTSLNNLSEFLKNHWFINYSIRLCAQSNGLLKRISATQGGSLYILNQPRVYPTSKNIIEILPILDKYLKKINASISNNKYSKIRKQKENHQLIATVVTVVNNRPEFIERAIKSVFKQKFKDKFEYMIIVNGGYHDKTIKVIDNYTKIAPNNIKFTVKIVDINNIGFCLNLASKIAEGFYYIQLDSDDELTPNAVEKIVNEYDKDPYCGMVIGSYIYKKGNSKKRNPKRDYSDSIYAKDSTYLLTGIGAPRSIPFYIIKEVGYYTMNDIPYCKNYAEDYEIFFRIIEQYSIRYIPDYIYIYYYHKKSSVYINKTCDRVNLKQWIKKDALKRRIKLNQKL